MKTIIAIPAYNCEKQLPRVLDGIDCALAAQVDAIWVVDNGSSDATVQAAVEYAQRGRLPNLHVFQNLQNVSLGGTHKTVFTKARALGATHVVILHGDDQAMSSEVATLLQLASDGGPQTVLGARFSPRSRLNGYDWKRVAGNRVLNRIYSLVSGRRLQDLGSGLNLFHLPDLPASSYMLFGNRLSFNYELILDLVTRDVPFRFEPITWSESDQTSNARNLNIFLEALQILVRWRFGQPISNEDSRDPATVYDWKKVH